MPPEARDVAMADFAAGRAQLLVATTVIVWLVTAIATMLLPFLLAKAGVKHAREEKEQTAG